MKKLLSKIKYYLTMLFLGFLVCSLGGVLLFRFVPVPLTPLMIIRSWESLGSGEFVGVDKTWVPLKEISASMQKAVLKAEDYRFFEHNGFDYSAIKKAYQHNRTHNSKKGASTISQQTAKNVFLWPKRSWLRKGLEAYFTVLIEFVWPKDRIMEVYLNVIELGPGVYGVEAAAQKYFKRSAIKLNPHQASLIAAVLPNPRRFQIQRPSIFVLARQRRIIRRVAPQIPKEAVRASRFFDYLDFKFNQQREED